MEKIAQVFYNENYADEDENEEEKQKKNKKEKNIQIFSKKIEEEIENCDVFTVVTSEAAMKQIQLINKKYILNNEFKKIENSINKFEKCLNPIEIEQSIIAQSSFKITTLNNIDEQQKNINKKINYNLQKYNNNDVTNQIPSNSISIILNELEKKYNNSKSNNKNNNNNSHSKNNNKNNDNCVEKINKIINSTKNKNNKINDNKLISDEKNILKNLNSNCIVIQGGKTTNNINININHLTIGHKYISQNEKCNIINGLSDLNNNNSNSNNLLNNKKTIKKFKNNNKEHNSNSLIKAKENDNNKKVNNYILSNPQGTNIKDKTKNKGSSLTLPPPDKNIISTLTKKIAKIYPSTTNSYNQINNLRNKPLKETRNKSVFRGGYNSCSINNFPNYKNNISNFNKTQQKFGKITIYTNNANYLKNVINNINFGTTQIKKNNSIKYNKNNGVLSVDRSGGRSTSNLQKRPKKVFSSILQFNGGNAQILNLKNTLATNKHMDNINNPLSPLSKDKKNDIIPLIKKNENNNFYRDNYRALKIKDFKLKGKHFNLHKILNIGQSNKRTKSTGK